MLNDKLDKYLKEDYYPFHMPGHKRSNKLRSDLPYQRDLTEIDGFDNLNDPQDIFINLEEKIANIYQVEDAVISTNGSTCGILSTIRSLTYANTDILVQRSCHKSVYNAIEICGLSATYIDVVVDEIGAIVDINWDDLNKKIAKTNFAAVVVTSPSYEGYRINLEKLHEICDEHGISLVVDMAHGSHLVLDADFKPNFDIAITSFHKNMSALTPAAAVLINNKDRFSYEIRRNMSIFQTSSPSYVILQSIDEMVNRFEDFGELKISLDDKLDQLYKLNLDNLKLIEDANKDRSKILISTAQTNLSGFDLLKILKEYKIEIEMAYPLYGVLISTIFDSKEGFDRLSDALISIDKNLIKSKKSLEFSYKIPGQILDISDMPLFERREVSFDQAIDKMSAGFIYAYPPGIPLVAPGELIDNQIISNIKSLKKNGIKLNIDDKIMIVD